MNISTSVNGEITLLIDLDQRTYIELKITEIEKYM